MDSLPTETLLRIAEAISLDYPPSLTSLALTNKRFHAVSTTWRLRNIKFHIISHRKLRRDVDKCLEILNKNQNFRHVRRLQITGSMPEKPDDDSEVEDMIPETVEQEWTLDNNTWNGSDDIFGAPGNAVLYGHGSIEMLPEEDAGWSPLVKLLKRLPNPQDLTFGCSNQFPASLLTELKEHHPRCRLHLCKFRFRSLGCEETNTHEMAVATLPNLHSIKVRHTGRNSATGDDYNEEATMCLLRGLAPNLKRLVITQCRPVRNRLQSSAPRSPKGPWKGFSQGPWSSTLETSAVHRTALESLQISGNGRLSVEGLRKWQDHVSFDTLQKIQLGYLDGELLQWAAANTSFPNLTELGFTLDRKYTSGSHLDFTSCAVAFFNSLTPLDTLKLSGSIDLEIFHAVLKRHGTTLRNLKLRPSEPFQSHTRRKQPIIFTRDDVIHMQESCPLLEDLTMPIQRSKGSAAEVDMYRAFGKMRNLTHLVVKLDYSNPVLGQGSEPANDPSFDEWMQGFLDVHVSPRRGHVRDMMLNAAVDEPLARSIWSVICATKPGRPLIYLALDITGHLGFGTNSIHGAIYTIIHHLQRWYLFERSVRDDNDRFTMTEIGREDRETDDKRNRENEREAEQKGEPRQLRLDPAMEVFRRIWPEKEGSVDWRDDWSSLPLQI